MKPGLDARGYTIIEVMIVMAITTALLVGVMAGISGQQRRTEFSQSVNDFQSQINDVINTVSTGYAVNTQNFNCTAPGGLGPQLDTTPPFNTQGKNKDCIVLGRAMQMAVGTEPGAYNTYTVLGQRQDSAGKEVTSINAIATAGGAIPTVASATNGGADSFDTGKIQYGVTTTKMFYTTDGTLGTAQNIGAVAFLSSLGQYTGCTNLCSGTTNVQLYAVQATSLNAGAGTVTPVSSGLNAGHLLPVPGGSVVVCLKSGGTSQYGVITIGNNNRQLSTKLDIVDTSGATALGCLP